MAEQENIRCRDRLEAFLHAEGVPYEILRHRQAYTMSEVAAALHVTGNQVAKVVMVEADGEIIMAVVPAPQRLRLCQLQAVVGAKTVRLARESGFEVLFPDCAAGAMPPFGFLYQLPVYLDRALAKEETIVLRMGTYRHALRMAMSDYRRLVNPVVADLTGEAFYAERPAA